MEVRHPKGWVLVAVVASIFSTGCNDNSPAGSAGPVVAIQGGSEEVIDTDVFPDNLHLVTDVILTMGQSNAAARGSKFQPDLFPAKDRLDARIVVWTQNEGWKIANPTNQIWEYDRFPARFWDPVNSSNSPGFQIARAIVDADPSRVVAFIPTSTPGRSIRYWRFGDEPYDTIKQRVENALNQLPSKFNVDLIWWMQGESDAEPSDFYRRELAALIDSWRGEPWYGSDQYFIANETAYYRVNEIFRELRSDGDRIIGNRVQQIYFNMRRATDNY